MQMIDLYNLLNLVIAIRAHSIPALGADNVPMTLVNFQKPIFIYHFKQRRNWCLKTQGKLLYEIEYLSIFPRLKNLSIPNSPTLSQNQSFQVGEKLHFCNLKVVKSFTLYLLRIR